MKRVFMVVVALLAAHFFLPASAHALEVSLASIQRGEVHVVGRGASNASVRWQGVQVTTATRVGTFNFSTEDVPATCVGELTDGVETLFIAVNGCTASAIISPEITAAVVPVTGQTTCFDSFGSLIDCAGKGQDGEFQAGVPFPDPRFSDNGDGTIKDNLTGLIWLKNANCPNATRAWQTALDNVADLNSTGTMNGNNCGDTSNGGTHQTDWRLPNVRELHSLAHYGNSLPALPPGHPFTNFQSSRYWSSTTLAGFPGFAWVVAFSFGEVTMFGKTAGWRVLAVRGGL